MVTLKLELRHLKATLAQIPDFPFADNMEDIVPVLNGIREGKIDFENLKGKSLKKILLTIQDIQKKKLIKSFTKDKKFFRE